MNSSASISRALFWRCWSKTAWSAVAGLAIAGTASATQYTLTDLGTVGDSLLGAYGVNDAGQVVGAFAFRSGQNHMAFLWTAGTGMQIIGLAGENSSANAISRLGDVAGESSFGGSTSDAFLWTPGGGVQDLGNLGNISAGRGINSAQHVVGGSFLQPFGEHGFFWTQATGMLDMGGVAPFSTATCVNESDVVAGTSISTAGASAFWWTKLAGFNSIGTLGGTDSFALGINSSGQIVGDSTVANGDDHPFLWTSGSGMIDLGSLGGTTGGAQAVNDSGVVVGSSTDSNGVARAFVWTQAGGLQDLNASVVGGSPMLLGTAYGVSNSGLIVGSGSLDGKPHAFLLTPVVGQEIRPGSYRLLRGQWTSGTLIDLYHIDGLYIKIRAEASRRRSDPPISILLNGTCPTSSPSDLRLSVASHVDVSNLRQSVEFFDFVSNQWVGIDSATSTLSDSTEVAVASNPSRFVRNGTNEIRARISWKATGHVDHFPWNASIDQAVWNISG